MNTKIEIHELLEKKFKLRKKSLRKEICLAWLKRKEAKLNLKRQRKIQKKLKREIVLEKIEDLEKKAKFRTKLMKTKSKIATLDYKINDIENRIKDKTKEIENITAAIADIDKEVLTFENSSEDENPEADLVEETQ